jgi:threonine aldolase
VGSGKLQTDKKGNQKLNIDSLEQPITTTGAHPNQNVLKNIINQQTGGAYIQDELKHLLKHANGCPIQLNYNN